MRTIYTTNAIIALLVGAAFVLPRFTPLGDGFVPAANGVLVFLALLGGATVVAIWLAAWTWRYRATLPLAGRWLGLAPAAVAASALAALVLFIRY